MLEVVFFESNQDLLEKLNTDSPPLVICPSPLIADNLRNLVPKLEVITVSKWTSDHLKSQGLTRSRKSELMIKLAAVWRHYFPAEKADIFLEAFELFTELRSYTLNLELLAEFFKELDDLIVKSILIFWTYVDQEKIIDEHLSYQKVTESIKQRPLWFIGFKHMSGVQIDMLKILSELEDVGVFFPKPVFDESLPNDWIRWLSDKEPTKINNENISATLKIVVLPKSKANEVLRKFFENHNSYDLVLAGTQISLASFQEAQRENSFFKTSEDLFAVEIELLFLNLKQKLKKSEPLNVEELKLYLIELQVSAADIGEYRKYKVIELALASIGAYAEFQNAIDDFALEIFKIIIRLNAPRVSLVTLELNAERAFLDVNDLSFRANSSPSVVLATGNMGGFRASEKILSEAMTKALKSIGPIKRAGLDFLFHKYEILSTLSQAEAVLLIEEQVLESDLSWREILKKFNTQDYDLHLKYQIKKVREYLLPKMQSGPFEQKHFSASRLQSYIDCPQKFYFSYIEKIDNRPDERSSLGPDELGNIEHQIIASYFSTMKDLNEINLSHHRKTCTDIFNNYLNSGKLILSETEKARSYNEIMHYSWNGIVFLIELIKTKNAKTIKFEVPLNSNPWKLVGSIDCLLDLGDNKITVIDFKRSSTASGTKSETIEFKKIQLWVYLLTLKNQGYKIDSFGYLNIGDLAENKLFFETDDAQKLLENSLGPVQTLIETTITNINKRITFNPEPRDLKVCSFCPVALFCLKGGLIEN